MIPASPYCERIRSRLDDHHDGDLSGFMKTLVSRHLLKCNECRREFDVLEQTIETIRTVQAPRVSARLLRNVVRDLTGPGGGSASSVCPPTGFRGPT